MRRPLPTCMFFLFLFPLTLHMALTYLDTTQPHWLAVYEQVYAFSSTTNLRPCHGTCDDVFPLTKKPSVTASFTALPASTISHHHSDFMLCYREHLPPAQWSSRAYSLIPVVRGGAPARRGSFVPCRPLRRAGGRAPTRGRGCGWFVPGSARPFALRLWSLSRAGG